MAKHDGPTAPDGHDELPDATREIGAGSAFGGPAEATALIDADSMEGLQASSRRGSSMPPPSDAELTRTLEPEKLNELVGGSQPPGPTKLEVAPPSPRVMSSRSRYTLTLQSAQLPPPPRPRIWPLLLGTVTFGAGLGAFLAIRPPSVPASGAASVELLIRASPESATISLDGVPLQGKPARATEERASSRRRRVTIAAPGYDSQTIEVSLDVDSVVDVALIKTPSSPAKEP